VSVIGNIADIFLSEIFTKMFQSIEAITFLCLKLIVSNYLEIPPFGYVSASAQKQWQNAMWLRRSW